jgi:hypothetical protein
MISLTMHPVYPNGGIIQQDSSSVFNPPVLATCGIRRPESACENPLSSPLLLAVCTEEEYNLKH